MTKIRDFALIVFALVFLPQDSRVILFDTQPSDWYGELIFEGSDETVIVAKNASGKPIKLKDLLIINHLSRKFESALAQARGDLTIPALSFSEIRISDVSVDRATRTIEIDDGRTFPTMNLTILTRADQYLVFVLITILMGSFCVLGVVASKLMGETAASLHDESPELPLL